MSVVICTKDRPQELAGALRSVARQEYVPHEVLLIDNGTRVDIREDAEAIIPEVRYIHERGPGLDFARNRALWSATNAVIAFLNDDAEADPYWVLSLAECFARYPQVGAVTAPL